MIILFFFNAQQISLSCSNSITVVLEYNEHKTALFARFSWLNWLDVLSLQCLKTKAPGSHVFWWCFAWRGLTKLSNVYWIFKGSRATKLLFQTQPDPVFNENHTKISFLLLYLWTSHYFDGNDFMKVVTYFNLIQRFQFQINMVSLFCLKCHQSTAKWPAEVECRHVTCL